MTRTHTHRRTLGRLALASLLATVALPQSAWAEPSELPTFRLTITDPNQAADAEATATAEATPEVIRAPDGTLIDTTTTASVGPNERVVERVRRDLAAPAPAAIAPVDVRARFDGLETKPALNVDTVRQASTAVRGEVLGFRGYWNYGSFIERGEIRVHDRGAARTATPLAIIPIDADGNALWVPPANVPADLSYRLRVYDARGRFDETRATALTLIEEPVPGSNERDDGLDAYGIDRTEIRGIRVSGGLVTVTGDNVRPDETVRVAGRSVPVDRDGEFVAEVIVPHGVSTVAVEIDGPRARVVERDIEVPETDVFYVALGEVTVGSNIRSDSALRRTSGDDPESVELTGRGAVYLKGRVKGDVLITAAADTREGQLDELYRGFGRRDAIGLLQRIDPDRFYPVYGDSSDLTDDAPSTDGLYVRIERDDSFVQYGSYSVAFEAAELATLERGVHGGVAQHRSLAQTSFGERKREVTVYAAQNETVPALETFLGTSGTIFRLQRQDIVPGTEKLSVEVRDRTTGFVTRSTPLEPGRDYAINPVAGRIILAKPLSSRAVDDTTVRQSGIAGSDVYLVARYEYAPARDDLDGTTFGGRAQAWVNDHLRVGATGQSETTDTDRRQLLGADVMLRHSAGTYVKAEIARSEGPGFAGGTSIDGGLTFSGGSALRTSEPANAYRVEAAVDIAALARGGEVIAPGAPEATAGAYYERFERGFTGQRFDVERDSQRYGAVLQGSRGRFAGKATADVLDIDDGGRRITATADASVAITERVTASVGVRHDDVRGDLRLGASTLRTGLDGVLDEKLLEGSRTDVAVEVAYAAERYEARAFAQGTAQVTGNRERNDRAGVGGSYRINDRFSVDGEVSYGTDGLGAQVGAIYEGDDDVSASIGYGFADDLRSTESRFSRAYSHALNARATKRYSDVFSVFSESRLGFTRLRDARDLDNSFGVELTPTDEWTLSAIYERGSLFDALEDDYVRNGGSLSAAYRGDKLTATLTGEARQDEGLNRDAEVYAVRGSLSYAPSDDWTIYGTGEWARTEGVQTAALDSDYVRLVAAGAYRPIEHDRINALLKYTYLSDLSPRGQITGGGLSSGPEQRSHAVSADVMVDVTPWLAVGGKYALRRGEVAVLPGEEPSLSQTAHLAILRADISPTENWDVMGEVRVLEVADADRLLGGVIGVWRKVGKVRVGGGYSFSSFSDDVLDLTHDDHGWFINAAAAF